jgi:hypothetical protein
LNFKLIDIEGDVQSVCHKQTFNTISPQLPFNLLYALISGDAQLNVCDYYKPGQGYLFTDVDNLIVGVVYLKNNVGSETEQQFINQGNNFGNGGLQAGNNSTSNETIGNNNTADNFTLDWDWSPL